MATQPTADEVKEIIDTNLSDQRIDAIVDDAELVVAGCISSLDPARQTAIIKYVAAHFIASMGLGGDKATLTSRKLGDASKSWNKGLVGEGFNATVYGKQALALDPNGCLLGLGKRKIYFRSV